MTGHDAHVGELARLEAELEGLAAARARIAAIAAELGPEELRVLESTAEGLLRLVRVPHLGGPVSLAHVRRGPR